MAFIERLNGTIRERLAILTHKCRHAYVLAATDFHYENLIAAGEHPVLIDLESLFHPHTEGFLFVHKQVQVPGGQNRPQLNGKYIDVQEYYNDIVHGFTIMYLLLLEHCQVLLADDSPLASFAQDKVRVILRLWTLYQLAPSEHILTMLRQCLQVQEFLPV